MGEHRPRSCRRDRRTGRRVRGWPGMSRWDHLLAVQEHDTNLDQLVHRRANLPERGELDAAMASLRSIEAAVARTDDAKHELVRSQQRLEDEIASLTDKATAHDKTLYSGTIANPRELPAIGRAPGRERVCPYV